MTWAPERDTLPPEERPTRATVTIDGPFRAEGFTFPGCSNWSGPAHTCTCETWEGVECRTCQEEITDGEWIVTKTVQDEYGDGWEIRVEAWHRQCPPRTPGIDPETQAVVAESVIARAGPKETP